MLFPVDIRKSSQQHLVSSYIRYLCMLFGGTYMYTAAVNRSFVLLFCLPYKTMLNEEAVLQRKMELQYQGIALC